MMTDTSYDQSGAARQALLEIYRDYGTAGLDNDVVVNQLLPDLLPNSPREASVVRAAASVGVAGLLNARFAAHMPVDSAVRDVASLMMQRHALDQFACLWIVTEYSTVLGHPLAVPTSIPSQRDQPVTSAPPAFAAPAPFAVPPPAAPVPPASATQLDSGYGQPGYAPAAPYQQPSYPQSPTPPYRPTSTPPYQQTSTPPYPQSPAPQSPAPQYPPTTPFPASTPAGFTPATPGGYAAPTGGAYQPPYAPPVYNPGGGGGSSKTGLIIALVVVAVLVIGGGITAIVLAGGKKSPPHGNPSTPVSVSVSPSVSPSPESPSPTVVPLDTILPKDVDASADCDEDPSGDLPEHGVGVIKNYSCTEPSGSTLPGALVFAYQMKDKASYDATWKALNAQLSFDPTDSHLADRCPSSSTAGGLTTWHKGDNGPDLGALECWAATKGGYVYMWGWEDYQSIFIVHGTDSQSKDAVDTWWRNES
jgi:hypothetical protein